MNNKESYERILYIDKDKFLFVLISALAICGVIGIAFKEFPGVSSPVYSIIYLVASSVVIILTTSILNIEKAGYYKYVRIIFYFIIIYNIKFLLPKISEPNSVLIMKYTRATTISILINAIALILLKISTIINKKGIKNNIMYISFFSLLSINHLFLIMGKENGITFFIDIINLCLIVLITINLKEYKLIKEKEINILLFIVLMLSIVSSLNIISIIFERKILMCSIIMELIIFISFSSYTIFTLTKVLNNPYKGLFNDLYKQNINMNILDK